MQNSENPIETNTPDQSNAPQKSGSKAELSSPEETATTQSLLIAVGISFTLYNFFLFEHIRDFYFYCIDEWRNYLLILLMWVLNFLGLGAWFVLMEKNKPSILIKIAMIVGGLIHLYYPLIFFIYLFRLIFN